MYLIERDVVQEVNAILFVTLAIAVAIPGLTSMAIANVITHKPMDNCNSNGCDGWHTCDNPIQPQGA